MLAVLKKLLPWKNNFPAVIPAVLAETWDEFELQNKKIEGIYQHIQIDIMDGSFVPRKSFDQIDPSFISQISLGPNTKIDLHLMVEHPLVEIKKWENVKNIYQIFFHIESADDPKAVISQIKSLDCKVGIALKPETSWEQIMPFVNEVDTVLFLTVNPGQQGGTFLPGVGKKILEFRLRNLELKNITPVIAVDGGVNVCNIMQIRDWGVNLFCVGSTLMKAGNALKIKKELINQLFQ